MTTVFRMFNTKSRTMYNLYTTPEFGFQSVFIFYRENVFYSLYHIYFPYLYARRTNTFIEPLHSAKQIFYILHIYINCKLYKCIVLSLDNPILNLFPVFVDTQCVIYQATNQITYFFYYIFINLYLILPKILTFYQPIPLSI